MNYYKVKPTGTIVADLQQEAYADPTNIAANEAYYEISQAFNAFGHAAVSGTMPKERLEKLYRYAENHTFKPDMDIMYEVVKFCAADAAQSAQVMDKVSHTNPIYNPFQEKGDRNVGTPY